MRTLRGLMLQILVCHRAPLRSACISPVQYFGVEIVTCIAQMVDNVSAMPAVYEQFAVVAATLWMLWSFVEETAV